MKQFIATESSSGKQFVVNAASKEDAYRVFGREVYKMPDPIDTGNVDIDIYPVHATPGPSVVPLDPDETDLEKS